MSDKVFYLAAVNRSSSVDHELEETLTCKTCRNKTWKIVYQHEKQFPMVTCACCGQHAGRIGWAEEE